VMTVTTGTYTTSWPTITASIVYGTALSATQLDATASIPGSYAYTPALNTVLHAGANQALSATFTPTDTIDYNTTTLTNAVTVTTAALTITASSPTKAYGAALPALTASYTGFVNGDTSASLTTQPTVATAATGTSPVGSYSVTASGAMDANYTISYAPGTLTITPVGLTITAASFSRAYNTTNPTLTVSYAGFVNGDSSSSLTTLPTISTTATTGSVVGTYPITASGAVDGNYTIGYVAGVLTVTQAVPILTWAQPASIVYGTLLGATQLDAVANVPGAFTYTPAANTALHVGTHQLLSVSFTPSDVTDYSPATASTTITVTPAQLTVTANNASRSYGAADPTYSATITGFKNGDTTAVLSGAPIFQPASTINSPVGMYNIVPYQGTLAAANYTFTFVNGTLTIGQAVLTVTANNLTKVYGAALPTLTYAVTGFLNGDTTAVISGAPILATSASASSPIGTYSITVAVTAMTATNYSFTGVTGTLTISPAVLTVTGVSTSRSYGAANPVFTDTITGLVNNDPSAVIHGAASITTTASTSSPVGGYPIVPALGTLTAANYTFAFVNGTLTITAVPLTITASNVTTGFDIAPVFSASYSGFVNGDSASSLGGSPSFSTTASLSSPVGTYPITPGPGTIADQNYSYVYMNGTLTILAVGLTVTVNDQTLVTGEGLKPYTVSYSTSPVGQINGSLSYTLSPTTITGPGRYTISAAGISSPNYQITFVSGVLTVLGTTQRVSVTNATQSELEGDSALDAISDGGRYVLYTTDATNMDVAGYDGQDGLIYSDQTSGAEKLVAPGLTGQGSLSGNGQYVTYITPLDQTQPYVSPFEVMVTNMSSGTTTCQSVTPAGVPADNYCTIPLISDNGQFVAFSSLSGVLTGVPNDGTNNDIIYRDCVNNTTRCLSLTPGTNGVPNTGDSELAALSADGRYVAFSSSSTQLVAGTVYAGDNQYGAYIYDTQANTITRVDLTPSGGQPDNGVGYGMSFSIDGRYLTFSSTATDLVSGVNSGIENVYIYDSQAPAGSKISAVSITKAGVQADGACYAPKISANGQYVAFICEANNLDSIGDNALANVFVADTQAKTLTEVSLGTTGAQADEPDYYQIGFSRDGSVVSWYTDAGNLVPNDDNSDLDVFLINTWVTPQAEDDSSGMPQSDG